jgi:hypothetical protein
VPTVASEVEEQSFWAQHKDNPAKLTVELLTLKPRVLSEKAKAYLSTTSENRKMEIIEEVLDKGINEKDAICAVTVMKDSTFKTFGGVGNLVLGTELNRLYILDPYGHKIVHEKIIEFAPCMLFSHGQF